MESMTNNPPNILVVDDVTANLVVLTELIRNAGYIARPVTSARQAVSAIEALLPHLILLDVSMPELDGFVFCSMLKKNAKTRDIPIIFISAMNTPEDKIKGFQLGAVDFITKPFDTEEVTLRINTHLKNYKMQQELELHNKKLYKIINDQLRKIYEGQKNIIHALTKLVGSIYPTKGLHIQRVGKKCKILAMSMQLSHLYRDEITNSFIESIELVAPLHDIGKIAISDCILQKNTKLTPEEWEIMKTHTEIGANIMRDIYAYTEHNEYIKMAIDIAWAHHERWDGTGFPRGLSGTDIPLSARVVAIIDAYDSLISDKSYRRAYTHEESMKIINSEAGKKLDPNIVDIFNKIQKQIQS